METIKPYCSYCLHYRGRNDEDVETCGAFPDGIPTAILEVSVDHRYPFEGDAGIRFEFRLSLIKEAPLYIFGAGAPGTFDLDLPVKEARR